VKLSIRQRLTLWYTLVLMASLVAFAGVIFFGGAWQLQRGVDQELRQTARLLAPTLTGSDEPVLVDTAYRLLKPDGQVLYASGLPVRRVPITPAALAAARRGQMHLETIRLGPASNVQGQTLVPPLRVLTVPLGTPVTLILQVGKAETDIPRLRSLLLVTLLIALALGLPLAALGGWWLAGRALNPVRAMTQAANRIEARNLAERLPQPSQDDELGQLAGTLNGLLDRLQAAFQRERRFTADVSHDLRTPLAVMKSTVGVVLNRPRSAEDLRGTLVEVDDQIDQVSGLLDATLFLSRADDDELRRSFIPLDLSELLTDLVETTAPYADEERRQDLTGEIAAGLRVNGDRDQLTRLFLNLLDNAMRYTPAGGAIRVTGWAVGGQAVVAVADNGVGIAPDDLPHIFERFYRADKARSAGTRGSYGLGLSIAQAVAHVHGGEISVVSELGKGSTFTVSLPTVSPAAEKRPRA